MIDHDEYFELHPMDRNVAMAIKKGKSLRKIDNFGQPLHDSSIEA